MTTGSTHTGDVEEMILSYASVGRTAKEHDAAGVPLAVVLEGSAPGIVGCSDTETRAIADGMLHISNGGRANNH